MLNEFRLKVFPAAPGPPVVGARSQRTPAGALQGRVQHPPADCGANIQISVCRAPRMPPRLVDSGGPGAPHTKLQHPGQACPNPVCTRNRPRKYPFGPKALQLPSASQAPEISTLPSELFSRAEVFHPVNYVSHDEGIPGPTSRRARPRFTASVLRAYTFKERGFVGLAISFPLRARRDPKSVENIDPSAPRPCPRKLGTCAGSNIGAPRFFLQDDPRPNPPWFFSRQPGGETGV